CLSGHGFDSAISLLLFCTGRRVRVRGVLLSRLGGLLEVGHGHSAPTGVV
ncbi:hypothetical protein LCGC14_2052230, partial [marine sediment metagenome]